MTVLLDGQFLAALVITEHEHHDRVGQWLAAQPDFAICPMSEAALLRFLLRLGESPQTGLEVLTRIRQHPDCTFWPDDLSLAELPAEQLDTADHLTTSYLVALARAKGAKLATYDPVLAARFPADTELLPS